VLRLGGIRNKAARGELHRSFPIGFVWSDEHGEGMPHDERAEIVLAPRGVNHPHQGPHLQANYSDGAISQIWKRAEFGV
jgi:hypothetical protein